jgi:ABC-type polysaccharide/polyol phosphate export permease
VIAPPIYDSATRPTPVLGELNELWTRRGLLRLLVARDLAARYKGSLLGVWWTLLNPVLEMAVLWLVFSNLFRFSTPATPYAVYLLAGIVLVTLFRETVLGVTTSMINNAPVLSKIYVPPEVFAVSTALALLVSFCTSFVLLIVVMVVESVSIPATLPLVIVPVLLLLALGTGVGLALAPLAVRFPDILELLRVLLTLVTYLAPVFYPFSIVPKSYRLIERLNPLYHFVTTFRDCLYGDSLGPWTHYAAMLVSAAVILGVGSVAFARAGRKTLALI